MATLEREASWRPAVHAGDAQLCGERLRVEKLALKLCDTIESTGMYRMRDAVHLEMSAVTARRTAAVRRAAASTGRRHG